VPNDLVAAWRVALPRDPGFSMAAAVRKYLDGVPGWTLDLDGFYAHARRRGVSLPGQGWKIHVAARPDNAAATLERCAPVLVRAGAPFKFAQDLAVAYALVSGRYERTGIAKFITAYPGSSAECASLLADLADATAGLQAAVITGDARYRADAPVYYRYGVIAATASLADDGRIIHPLRAPDGTLTTDNRTTFRPPPWVPPLDLPRHPEVCSPAQGGSGEKRSAGNGAAVLGPYRVLSAIQQSGKGGVFRAADSADGSHVIVKQARVHTGVRIGGGDARDQLHAEAEALRALEHTGRVPRVLRVFDTAGSSFLVTEEIPGETLRAWLRARWRPRCGPPAQALRVAADLAAAVREIHADGWAVGDLSPGNCIVSPDPGAPGGLVVRLVDLGGAARTGRATTGEHTSGYGAPEVSRLGPGSGVAEPASDCYALGGLLFFLATAADPPDGADGHAGPACAARLSLAAPANHVASTVAGLAGALLAAEPERRPTACAAERIIRAATGKAPGQRDKLAGADASDCRRRLAELLADGIGQLRRTRDGQASPELWPVPPWQARYDQASFYHGSGGPLAVLTRAAERGMAPPVEVAAAARWLAAAARLSPRILPGLHSGRGGVVWVLADAARVTGDAELSREALVLARGLPADGSAGLAHGSAGAGLALLRLWTAGGADDAADQIRRLADRLAHPAVAAEPSPADAAGTAVFLAAAGKALGGRSWLGAADDLLASAVARATWRLSALAAVPVSEAIAALSAEQGVACVLSCAAAAAAYGLAWPSGLAARAAAAFEDYAAAAPSGYAHGVAGWLDALTSLEALDGSLAPGARTRLAAELVARSRPAAAGGLVPDDSGTGPAAEFAHGSAGVLYAISRFLHGGAALWEVPC
jgi:serine/threonine protein kinase